MARKKPVISTNEFAREFVKVNMAFRQFIQQKFRQHNVDLTFEMLQILGCLWQKDGINQQEIANSTLKDKASMTYLIDNMAKRDLLYRQEDENDRRNKLIFLKEPARQIQQQIQPWIDEMYGLAARGIPAEKIKDCLSIVQKIEENLSVPPV